jgi:LAS superfamily LD-carboxypeptidase LdcB
MAQVSMPPITAKTTPKIFNPNQFRNLYRTVLPAYPNTEAFVEPPPITGNLQADAAIRKVAEKRGFQLTRIPVMALVKTNEPMLKGETDDLLQSPAQAGWLKLKAAAKKDGIPIALLSAYRSPEWQRDLFGKRLAANGASPEQIAIGNHMGEVESTLSMTSIPGYSRHHTGYTVDFWCDDQSGNFGSSSCHDWLSKENYLHAKEFGWIPSYPAGADEQGPEPEPWEYVWVGREVLFQ